MITRETDNGKHERVWIGPDIFEADLRPSDWPDHPELRSAVDWLLTFVEPKEWQRRRFAALQHFVDTATGSVPQSTGTGRFFHERDRFACLDLSRIRQVSGRESVHSW